MFSGRKSSRGSRVITSTRPISSYSRAKYHENKLHGIARPSIDNLIEQLSKQYLNEKEVRKDNLYSNTLKHIKNNITLSIMASTKARAQGNPEIALQKAKEAKKFLDELQDTIFKFNKEENMNVFNETKYLVMMQLADAYTYNEMYENSLKIYEKLAKDKNNKMKHSIELCIGNIYMAQHKYEDAIKHFNYGLVYLGDDMSKLKARFHYCSGMAFIELANFHKAMAEFTESMKHDPTIKAGYHLVLCHSVLSSIDSMREAFSNMLHIKVNDNKIEESDILGNLVTIEYRDNCRFIGLAAKIVASKVKNNNIWEEAYIYVQKKLTKTKYYDAINEFEIAYALAYMDHKMTEKAIEKLKRIKQKDTSTMSSVSTNLSYIYLLEKDFEKANYHSEIALQYDKYNVPALVNKGYCLAHDKNFEDARDCFLEAIGIEANCIEALYNLGLVSKRLGLYEKAFNVFEKLSNLIPKSPEVHYELAECLKMVGSERQYINFMNRLINVMPTDPSLWKRIGKAWEKEGNENQALLCFTESYKYSPSDIDVVKWLGEYHLRHHNYERAKDYFGNACLICQKDSKLKLLYGQCYEMLGMMKEALDIYENAYHNDQMNISCIKKIIEISQKIGFQSKCNHYVEVLQEIEQYQESQQDEELSNFNNNNEAQLITQSLLNFTGNISNIPNRWQNVDDLFIPTLTANKYNDSKITTVIADQNSKDIWEDYESNSFLE
ncbi:Intraflagellar transport protein 88 like protein [Tritrichomonas foetus]|uniref:Intraflagellar transport protein 88 like protein n=1 Tax=Tritrichomonas foetus TaxID=1144522 RepID=A0A1J4K884_9EUKA|nr:Intraflagellar transport protein 88 like protein [Tritrichomonas foetus]|eukprot:OHT07615.1 Intraflagellar transport protein 88 like protein [Tritrichomonas foetus]